MTKAEFRKLVLSGRIVDSYDAASWGLSVYAVEDLDAPDRYRVTLEDGELDLIELPTGSAIIIERGAPFPA